jgi:hypothetical protein
MAGRLSEIAYSLTHPISVEYNFRNLALPHESSWPGDASPPALAGRAVRVVRAGLPGTPGIIPARGAGRCRMERAPHLRRSKDWDLL